MDVKLATLTQTRERTEVVPLQEFDKTDPFEHLEKMIGKEAVSYIKRYVNLKHASSKVLDTTSRFNVESIDDKLDFFINIKRVNDIRYLNKFFESVNNKLVHNGIFIGRVETYGQRKRRIFDKYHPVLSRPVYCIDFIYKRIFPKWAPTKKLYFFLSKGNNRVLSKAEVLGRLVSCGFDIVDVKIINNMMYFVCRSVEGPCFDMSPSYGPFFRMNRIGQNGKNIRVFKLRTMHPYAEYLQEYIYRLNKLDEGGKFRDDFRITVWGRIFRKLWLDELPMLINWFRGDLKLVGVRPLSKHYIGLYRKDLVERRLKYKPGLVPPFYADLPKTLDEIMDSEERYLEAYEKSPITTDVRYFFRAMYNIFIKRARSR